MNTIYRTILLGVSFCLGLAACATDVKVEPGNGGVVVGVDNGQTGVQVGVDATKVGVGVDTTLAAVTVEVARQAANATGTAAAGGISILAAGSGTQTAVANAAATANASIAQAATANAGSIASPVASGTQAGFLDIPIPTNSVATQPIREILPEFPIGEQTLAGVFFRADEKGKVTTQCQATTDESVNHGLAPTEITIPVQNLANITQVFLLLNAGFTTGFANQPVGSLTLVYSDGSRLQQALVLNMNVREWGINTPGMVTTLSDPTTREVYRGKNRFGDIAVLDMLEMVVPAANVGKTLTGIVLGDTSQTTTKNANPCLFVVAATARQVR